MAATSQSTATAILVTSDHVVDHTSDLCALYARFQYVRECPAVRISAEARLDANKKHCAMCYCFVCDVRSQGVHVHDIVHVYVHVQPHAKDTIAARIMPAQACNAYILVVAGKCRRYGMAPAHIPEY